MSMQATHRHGSGPEHEFEPVHGLPEVLPAGEQMLWQGKPDWRALALRAFHLRKLVLYFAALLLLRGLFVLADGGSAQAALSTALWLLPVALLGLALVLLIAWLSARGTAYTLTDRRVVMRIGIVLTVTFNLPFKRIVAADFKPDAHGGGDIALALKEGDRIGWLHLWPHVRPWKVARAQPTLRCLPDAAAVSALLTRAWRASAGYAPSAPSASPAPATADHGAALQARPALSAG